MYWERIQRGFRDRLRPLFLVLLLCSSCAGVADEQSVCRAQAALEGTVRSGDIIIRSGRGALSALIRAKVGDTILASHCGVVVGDRGGWRVVHSLSRSVSQYDGMQECSLVEFIEQSEVQSLRVVRFREAASGAVIAHRALGYLRRRLPFNESLDMSDTSRFFCSQLPLHILRSAFGVVLFVPDPYSHRDIPRFSLFLDPRYFDIVY